MLSPYRPSAPVKLIGPRDNGGMTDSGAPLRTTWDGEPVSPEHDAIAWVSQAEALRRVRPDVVADAIAAACSAAGFA